MSDLDQFTKVHLGCGEKRLNGFLNVDARASAHTDLVCDFYELPFADNSVELFYMCHSLEHIPMHQTHLFIRKLFTMLKPSGKIYISVPDFAVLSSLYLSGRVPLSSIVRAIHGGQEYPGNTHYMSYDQDILTNILLNSGYSGIHPYRPEDFLPHGFTDTSTYEIGRRRISLNLCGSK